MKRTFLTSLVAAGFLLASSSPVAWADQRPRNPGGGSSGGSSSSSGGSSSRGGSSSSSGGSSSSSGSTGRVAQPRGGGGASWGGGGSTASRPSQPSSSGRRPARVSGGRDGSSVGAIPPYSRARNGAPVTGYGVPRGSVATLPPIISGPIYWGPNDWYFYPWGYGGLTLGYLWDPWMWGGYYGGSTWSDPYWSGGATAGDDFDDDDFDDDGGAYAERTDGTRAPNPLDARLPTGSLRLKAQPRDAEVFVDGFYAGRVDDFDGARQRLKITRGVHTIELSAPGYETVTLNVTVVPGDDQTISATLKRR